MGESRRPVIQPIRTFADDFAAASSAAGIEAKDTLTQTTTKTDKVKIESKPIVKKKKPAKVAIPPKATTSQQSTAAPVAVAKKAEEPIETEISADALPASLQTAVAQEEPIVISDAVETGAVVRETKTRKRFNLFTAIANALTGWFAQKKDQYEAAQPDIPQVEAAATRAETIQAATGTGALPARDDFAHIADRVEDTPVAAVDILRVEKPDEPPTPQWETDLVIEPTPTEEPIRDEPVWNVEPLNTPSEVGTPTPELAAPVVTEIPETAEPEALVELADDTPERITEPQPEPVAADLIAEKKTTKVATSSEATVRPTVTKGQLFTRVRIFVLLFVVASASVAGVALVVWGVNTFTTTEFIKPTVPSVITTDRQIPVSYPNNDLLRALNDAASSAGDGVVQLYFVEQTPDGERIVSTPETLNALALTADGSFVRNVETMTIGVIDSSTPFLVLRVQSFDTAFSGILNWETRIIDDLMPLFGKSPSAIFTDTTSENRDIRVATRGDNSEILYTFLNRNTLLIAADRSALAEVLTRLER